MSNLNLTALDQFSDAVAHSTLTFAQTTSGVNGTDTGSGSTVEHGKQGALQGALGTGQV